MQSISAFLDKAKFADFWWKNADVSSPPPVTSPENAYIE